MSSLNSTGSLPSNHFPKQAIRSRRYSRSSNSVTGGRNFSGLSNVAGASSARRDGSSVSSIDGESGVIFGSFTAGREDIRDGSARLAAMSMDSPSPSPPLMPLELPPTPLSTSLQRSSRPSGISQNRPQSITLNGKDEVTSEEDFIPTPTQSQPGSPTPDVKHSQLDPFNKNGKHSHFKLDHEPIALGDEVYQESSNGSHSEFEENQSKDGVLRSSIHDENSPLLGNKTRDVSVGKKVKEWIQGVDVEITPEKLKQSSQMVVTAIPAVILGVLMNILDGVSYGMIMFPLSVPAFNNFGGIGVSLFFISTIVAQLVFSGGGSIFKGGNGSMMIEVVPFYHVIVGILSRAIDESDGKSLVSTTMVAFALSSILTGITFFILGWLKLGSLSEFFPRIILVGCIGGVGAFLGVTGINVATRLDEGVAWSFRYLFESDILVLWTLPLALAILLRVITAKYSHSLIFPGYFLAIPVIFWTISLALGIPIEELRSSGWVFDIKGVNSTPFEYLTFFSFAKTDWKALMETIPTQLALVFFALTHVPINVPSLAISIGEDNVDTDRELVAHGLSNVLSGLLGSCPNYLVYSNSVLFYKVGGNTRLSGFLLAAASIGILLAGPSVIGYLPVCVVGALIFVLAIDLIKESIWDTWGRVNRFEYITIWAIVLSMTVFDFVMGIGVGIVFSCFFFVVSSSHRKAVRSTLSGSVARSTVRRHPKQSEFLKKVGQQTRILKLQGFLFFGTISACEATIRGILESVVDPIRFLVLDFSMASGVDFSAAEAFVRIQRLLADRGVVLIFCGTEPDSTVGKALQSVDLWVGSESVEVFENLNDALEYSENVYLRALYSKESTVPPPIEGLTVPSGISTKSNNDVDGFEQSPRTTHLKTTAKEVINSFTESRPKIQYAQPMPLLLQSFRPFSPEIEEDFCFRLIPYFNRVHVERGTILWESGDESDCFYLIESGMLRANYLFLDGTRSVTESMVSGTCAGELSFLSRTKRNALVSAERDSVLWKMTVADHERLGKEQGLLYFSTLSKSILRISIEEQDVLMGHLISSL